MNDDTLVLLLQLIKNNGSIENIINIGYSYSQVAFFIKLVIQEGYANYDNDFLEITSKGILKLKQLTLNLNRKYLSEWISPQEFYKCKPINKFDIYLPKKFSDY